MDDIGNLVYILVFIIWFLYRTFSKGIKKPVKPVSRPGDGGRQSPPSGPQGSPTQSTPPPVTFEDILRELTGAPPLKQEKEPEFVEDIPESFRSDYYPEPDEETTFEVFEPEPDKPTVTTPLTQQVGRFKVFEVKRHHSSKAARAALKMFKSKQGARQAIIMKEIFDRKY